MTLCTLDETEDSAFIFATNSFSGISKLASMIEIIPGQEREMNEGSEIHPDIPYIAQSCQTFESRFDKVFYSIFKKILP